MQAARTSITASAAQQLPAICPDELAHLSQEAGRELNQEQATRYRLRRLKSQLIALMLDAQTGGAR